ncbi:hypothetical protein PVMG_02271 [Plasmodium vivax Mauritania I]|uniref:Uncharacterized protein n=1 Tax=Plasmodium vivax Mauritania I TaxID=1035515 RepID=A0A0J9TEW3_PLAVI|nr:hypothetical protein PVMG_02271 [Plasmodium vivax Mauritania I]
MHIKKKFRFYNIAKENCINDECNYFTELQNFKNKINELGDLNTILNKCKYGMTSCEHGSNGEGDVPCLREKGNSFLNLIFCNSIEDIINVLLKFTIISDPILTLFVILFKVLTYKQYIDFKEKFNPNKPFSSEEVKLDDILRLADIEPDMKKNYSDAFGVLLKHIHHDGLFYRGNNEDACKYINYILYKKVEVEHETKRSYDATLSSLFKIFLDAYGKKLPGRKNRCMSSIFNIQPETFNKLNALYDVYDKYNKCSFYIDKTINLGCDDFKNFFDSYNNYMFVNESKTPKFNDILINIEEHAKDIFAKYIKGCKKDDYYIRSPRLFTPPRVQKPKTHSQEQIGQTGLQAVDSNSHSETHRITNTPQTQLSKDISISDPEQGTPRTDEEYSANVFRSESYDPKEIVSHQDSSHQETRDSSIGSNEEQSQSYSRLETPIRPSYFSETLYSGRPGRVGEHDISNEVEMPPSSFMNTITSTLKNVDPVPVVGVSGGMGALFLLFRVLEILNLHLYMCNTFK